MNKIIMNKQIFEVTNATEVLQEAVSMGIIPNIDTMLDNIESMKKQELLEQHLYQITKTIKDGKEVYSTYLPTEDGNRLYRRRNTLAELEDVIVDHYKELQEKVYISDVFHAWIDEKLQYGEIQKASYDRYQTDYERFFVNRDSLIMKKQFKHITYDDLESYIKSTIHDLQLTRKSYAGLRTLIRGIFKYGKKKKYTSLSITEFFGDLELSNNLFKKKIIDKEKEVFMEDEIPLVINYLRENPSLFNYGILFTFQTGLRVGELSALKPSDKHGRIIKVRRIEDKYRDENGKWVITIKEHSKTDAGNRDLILPSSACDTFEEIMKLRQDGEFLFEQNGKRIRGNAFNKHLSRICEKLDIPHRTMHKIRKTYGTTLIDNHVDERFITEQMGHADISTTKKLYYFSNKTRKAKEEQIEQAVYF